MNTNRIRIFLLGTSLAIGTVAGLAPMSAAGAETHEPRERAETVEALERVETVGERPRIEDPGVKPCDLVDCDGPVIDNPNIDPCDLVDCDKPVIDNPRIDPCDLVAEACTPKPGKPGKPSVNPDAPVKAKVAFTG